MTKKVSDVLRPISNRALMPVEQTAPAHDDRGFAISVFIQHPRHYLNRIIFFNCEKDDAPLTSCAVRLKM